MSATTREIVMRLFHAVESRNLNAVVTCFGQDAVFRHMPHDPEDIAALFRPALERSERVEWLVIAEAYNGPVGFVERVDRYVIDGAAYEIECNGVFIVDNEREQIVEMREYMDIELWRRRLGDVMTTTPGVKEPDTPAPSIGEAPSRWR